MLENSTQSQLQAKIEDLRKSSITLAREARSEFHLDNNHAALKELTSANEALAKAFKAIGDDDTLADPVVVAYKKLQSAKKTIAFLKGIVLYLAKKDPELSYRAVFRLRELTTVGGLNVSYSDSRRDLLIKKGLIFATKVKGQAGDDLAFTELGKKVAQMILDKEET